MAPNGWSKIKLGDLTKVITSGSRDWAKYYADSGSKFIRMTNLNRHGIHLLLDDLKYVSVDSISSDGKRTALQAGDILCSITAELGKIGWIPENFGEAYINQHTALIRIDAKKADSKFIAYQLSSNRINQVINSLNDAGAKAGLNLPTIKAIPIFYPPLIEQKKIAKILSTWDQAISATEKLLKNSQEQKKALMQQLLTGKKRLLDENGVKFSNEWATKNLESLVYRPLCYGVLKPGEDVLDGHPLIRIQDIDDRGFIDIRKVIRITDELHYEFRRTILNTNDLIISIVGTLGKVFVIPKELNGANITRAFAVIGADCKLIDTRFIYQYLNSSMIQEWLLNTATGNAQKVLNIAALKELQIPLPIIEEQRRIAEVLFVADQEIETIQKKLDCLKQEKKALMQQLLTGKKRVKVAA